MQLRNLEEGNPIELLEAIHYKPRLSYSDLCEEKLIKMGIITDGVLYKTEEEKGFSPESYQFSDTQKIEKKLFSRDIKMHFIDAINSKKVYLKDYSYILVTISRKEWNGPSISYAYKDAYVYFKDINDKTALKEADLIIYVKIKM